MMKSSRSLSFYLSLPPSLPPSILLLNQFMIRISATLSKLDLKQYPVSHDDALKLGFDRQIDYKVLQGNILGELMITSRTLTVQDASLAFTSHASHLSDSRLGGSQYLLWFLAGRCSWGNPWTEEKKKEVGAEREGEKEGGRERKKMGIY
ncbi:hypothetical protein L873DRAFT_160653 [Choiromyces venosus 120613-1]|uniref:Uncharacterized protein n=1 Tax=Choiromyces venosus 120613-1 TaxID=1336337 RepID=A0A3N4K2J3_9PEZI|nr:hypothetical protein L873DRAFT_160653 [Choiromyces venosus 120613-1]